MTNIDQLKKNKAEKEKVAQDKSVNVVLEMHQKQKKSIQSMIKLEGYKTIKDFWILQSKQATDALKNVRFSDLQEFGRVQAKANISDKFITFLDNLEK